MKQQEILNLLEKMTLEEKIDQLLQLAAEFYSENAEERTGPMADLGLTEATIANAGTTLGVSGAEEAIRIQKKIFRKKPFGYSYYFDGRYHPRVSYDFSDSIRVREFMGSGCC